MTALLAVLALVSRVLFSFADPAIDESSGLVDLGSVMVTTNDSGDRAVLYVVDPSTGRTVGHTVYAPAVTDVEALAPAGGDDVWVGDIGDNDHVRAGVRVYRVSVRRGERRVDAPSYGLVYPDGAHDAESLVVIGGRLYLITKGVLGGTVYAAPQHLDPSAPNRLRAVGSVAEFATDAALLPDGRHLLVRGYGTAEIVTVPGFHAVTSFELPAQRQGEGVSVGPGGRIRLSSEGRGSPVLQIDLPAAVTAALATPTVSPSPTASASPAIDPARGELPPMTTSSTPGPTLVIVGALVILLGISAWANRRRRR